MTNSLSLEMSSPRSQEKSQVRKKGGKVKPQVSHLNLSLQLLEAIQQGKAKIIKRLLDSRVDINVVTESGQSPLLLACSLKESVNREKITSLLLDRGCQINLPDRAGVTALMIAVDSQDESLVSKLLEKGADVGLSDFEGNTALCHAAKIGDSNILRTILCETQRHKIHVDQKNMRGLTPLLIAAQNGHLEVAKILVEKGKASLTIRDLDNFMTAEDWMKQTSFYSPSDLSFLSPRMRHKRSKKGIKTLADYLSNDELESTGSSSPNVYEFRLDGASSHQSSITLPHITSHHDPIGGKSAKSMFDLPSLATSKQSTTPSFSHGKPVPLTRLSNDRHPTLTKSPKADLFQSNYLRKRKTMLGPIRRSKFYSEGSLEPLSSKPPSLLRMDSVSEETSDILGSSMKRSQPLPFPSGNNTLSDKL